MMNSHHFLKFILIATLVILAKANVETDYDEGFDDLEKLPEPQPQVVLNDEPTKVELNKTYILIPDASFFIIIAIAAAVLMNIIVISALVVIKRRRVSAYRRMQLNRASPVFGEIHNEV